MAVLLPVLLLAACSSSPDGHRPSPATTPSTVPCGEGLGRVELGSPYLGGPTGNFTTDGSPFYVSARRFEHGGPFDPAKGSTAVYLGPADHPPTWDQQRNVVSDTAAEIHVDENDFTRVDLPGGRYWLWSSNGGDLVVVTCTAGGVTDPKPVSR